MNAMETLFRVEMLGRFGVQQENREITRFRTQKTAALLACLALYRLRAHPRDVLIERFWPGSELKAARTNLSVAINALRRQLEPPGVPSGAVLVADHSQVRLNPIAFATDVEDFENTLRDAAREMEATKRLSLWMTAIDLYRGDLLPGFYDDWVLTERDRLRDAYRAALRHTVKGCAETRQYERAMEYAHRWVQADPFREESHRTLMRLLMAVGRPHEALRQYQELERLLQNELQTVPSAISRELAARLQNIAPVRLKTPEVSAAGNPQRVPTADFHSPISDTQRSPLRIPLQFNRFFGREEEIARLQEMLGVQEEVDSSPIENPKSKIENVSRLVTLIGPGGTGKTRLSIEVARRVREVFPGGLWFIPLAEVHDPLRLGEALRDSLELPRQSHRIALEQVIAFLNGVEGPSLLILDNFEQITAGGAPVVWTLLNQVPLLRCLVTSRQPLSLPGERKIPVLPLPVPMWREGSNMTGRDSKTALPAASEWMAYPSVALFVDRAQAMRPEFQMTPRNAEAIAALCEKLEGIPLAIELAAARVGVLTPAQILERLAQRFELLASRNADKGERHRSLWTAIDWSYHLLSPDLQRFFARLSVFRGGWTLEAAEAVADSREGGTNHQTPEYSDGLNCLAQLREHSLIYAEESSVAIRFRMLETLREFAAEQLKPNEREEMARRHAVYCRQWVAGARLTGGERAVWFERFEEDFDNLRAALAWSLQEENNIEIGLQTANACGNFWWLRGHLSEGRAWYARLLERAGNAPTAGLGAALNSAGTLAYLQGDFQNALPLLERCMEVAHASGNEVLIGLAQETLGTIAYRRGDYGQARFHFEQSLAIARAQGVRLRVTSVLGNLANVAQSSGDFAASHALNEESLKIWREEGDRNGEARTLHNLANLAHSQGRLAEARAYYEQSLAVKREVADRYSLCTTLRGIAGVTIDQGDYATAAAYARESLALTREMNARADLVEGLQMLTSLAWAVGEWEAAARMYGTLEKIREEMNYPLPPVDQVEYDRIQTALREALGTAAYEAAKTEGRKLSLEQALAFLEERLAGRSL